MGKVLGFGLSVCLAVASWGCGDGGGAGTERPVPHPKDDTLRLNELQMGATHNSYHVETNALVSDWHYTRDPLSVQLDEQGIRSLELDVHWDFETMHHRVYHVPVADEGSVCDTFVECLEDVKQWSDAHPGHHPILIMIEPKDQDTMDASLVVSHLDTLDDEIRSVFPEDQLITPDLVRGGAATLADAIDTDGWPTLGEVRARVGFFLNGSREVCVGYAHDGAGLAGRAIFADSEPGDPWEAVRILNNPVNDATEIADALAAGRIVRTFADSLADVLADPTDNELDAALASGAQVVTTDVPVPRSDTTYVFDIPGGTPSRCNPVTAPPGCTSTDIEDPALLAP